MSVKTPVRWVLEQLDTALDAIPAYEDGRWYRYGDWGCRIGNRFRQWKNERL